MTTPTRISFVRHGQVHNPEGIFYGRLPGFGLSERGHQEAQAAARHLCGQGVAAVYSSPLLRARQTAQAIVDHCSGVPLAISRDLSEVHCPYDGQPRPVLDAIGWDVYAGTGAPYEQPADLVARTLRFGAAARSAHPGRHMVAATHGDVFVFTLLWAAGLPVEFRSKRRLAELGVKGGYPAHASIVTFLYHTADPAEHPSFEYVAPR
jgi:broad specificity phosphatase PhoE